jgi:excisionase family DNA binding protein
MFSIPEVAKRLGRGANTIRRWLEQGAFPNAERFRGSKTLIPETDVSALREAMKPRILRRARAA